MDLSAMLNGLKAALLGSVVSLGASLAVSFGTLVMGYGQQERQILSAAKQLFIDTYDAWMANHPGDYVNAIENATTAAYNKFAHDEGQEFHVIVAGVIDFMAGALKRLAGVVEADAVAAIGTLTKAAV